MERLLIVIYPIKKIGRWYVAITDLIFGSKSEISPARWLPTLKSIDERRLFYPVLPSCHDKPNKKHFYWPAHH